MDNIYKAKLKKESRRIMGLGSCCQVNVLQCTFEGVETVVGKYIRWKYVPLGYSSGKEDVFVVVVGSEYLSVFV